MNISLRKASVIHDQIVDMLAQINIVTEISLSEFHDVEFEINRANVELFNNDARKQRLLLAQYTIRGLIGAANAANGVAINLAKSAFIDKRIIQLSTIADMRVAERLEVIKGQLEKIKNNGGNQYYGENTVSTTVISAEQIRLTRLEILNLKRQRARLKDDILELNIKTEIPLNEEVVKTLTDEGIV